MSDRRLRLSLLALALIGLRVVALPDVILCGFRGLTGLPCPFCGLTRGLAALAHGNLSAALAAHPLTPLAAMLAAALAWWGPERVTGWWRPVVLAFGTAGALRLLALTL